MSYLISHTCTKATPIFESPRADSPVAEYGYHKPENVAFFTV